MFLLDTKFHRILGNEKIKEIIQGNGLSPEEGEMVEKFLKITENYSRGSSKEDMLLWDKIQSSPKKIIIIRSFIEINSEFGKEIRQDYKTKKSN